MDCLNRHDYDRDKCLDFFQAYRDCKKAWVRRAISLPHTRCPQLCTLTPSRDGTTQGRPTRWEVLVDIKQYTTL